MSAENSITVVVPTIPQRAELLVRALKSIDEQTLFPERILVVPAEPKEDAPATKQRGLMQSRTKWTAFLDDDDEFTPTHLERLLETALYHQADLAYPWYSLIDADGSEVDPQPLDICGYRDPVEGVKSAEGVPWGPVLREWTLTPGNGNVIHGCVLVRTELAQRVGGFPQRNTADWPEFPWEELGLWRRLLWANAIFAHNPERTYRWHRTHGKNTGGRIDLRKVHYG